MRRCSEAGTASLPLAHSAGFGTLTYGMDACRAGEPASRSFPERCPVKARSRRNPAPYYPQPAGAPVRDARSAMDPAFAAVNDREALRALQRLHARLSAAPGNGPG
jgi:hypothetical protein